MHLKMKWVDGMGLISILSYEWFFPYFTFAFFKKTVYNIEIKWKFLIINFNILGKKLFSQYKKAIIILTQLRNFNKKLIIMTQ